MACPPSQTHAHSRYAPTLGLLLVGWLAVTACEATDPSGGQRDAELRAMVPSAGAVSGELDCWLTIEFRRYPDDADLQDVRVHFYSDALTEPAQFDWRYIAQNDLLEDAGGNGEPGRSAESTRPGEAPPLGQAIRVRFPLSARPELAAAGTPIVLQAELYWGGRNQGVLSGSIEPDSRQQTARAF